MYYTKYRPQKFSEMSGPADVVASLTKQITSNKTAHAYLFVGPRGIGKTTAARIFAKALNCTALGQNGDPCDKCDSCVSIKAGSYLDLIEIDAASNRGIDDIRELREKIKLAPSMGKHKVYIIDEVHMLTSEAFNALLKTLEEPPKQVSFILCTTELHKVPDTIKSRCQVVSFKRASIAQLTKKLTHIASLEDTELDQQKIKRIASAANGGFRDAENLLQQIIEGELSIDTLFSLGTKESHSDFVDLLLEKNTPDLLHNINKLYENGTDLYVWSGELLKYLRELLFIKTGADNSIVETTDELLEKMKKQANAATTWFILLAVNLIMEAQNKIKNSFIPQLPLEVSIVKLCTPDLLVDSAEGSRTLPPEDTSTSSVEKKTLDTKTVDQESKKAKVAPTVGLEDIQQKWQLVLDQAAGVNNGIYGLLRTAKPYEIQGNILLLEVPFDFHKERIESTKNIRLVEECVLAVFESGLIVKCTVKKRASSEKEKQTGTLTDMNVMVPTNISLENAETLLEVFDGSLPF